jgi:hypothetical protein
VFVSGRNSKLWRWTDRMAEMKLNFTRIKQYFILYSVEWWDQSIYVFCKGCAVKRCGLNWPATKPVTAGTEYKQQEPQAMHCVSWRRLHNFICLYLPDVTDSICSVLGAVIKITVSILIIIPIESRWSGTGHRCSEMQYVMLEYISKI